MQPPQNRRASRRHKAKRSTKAVCLKGALGLGCNIALSVLDVSETGARLAVKEALKPGQDVEVSLESVSVSRPVKRVASVAWCVAAEGGTYCVGAATALPPLCGARSRLFYPTVPRSWLPAPASRLGQAFATTDSASLAWGRTTRPRYPATPAQRLARHVKKRRTPTCPWRPKSDVSVRKWGRGVRRLARPAPARAQDGLPGPSPGR